MERTPVQTAPPVPFPFGVEFQAKLVRVMLMDDRAAGSVLKYLRPEYFESPPLRWMVTQCIEYTQRYGKSPTTTVLMELARGLDASIRPMYTQAIDHLSVLEIREEEYIKDQVLEWVKRNLFVEAHQRTKNLFNTGDVSSAYDEMRKAMDKIERTVWVSPDRGWFFEELAEREFRREDGQSLSGLVSTGISQLDHMLGGGAEKGFLGLWMAYSKGGKALANGEPVLTPAGWIPIEDLSVGDEVIGGSTGVSQRVTGVFPQGEKECFLVRFSDGGQVLASGDHLWTYHDKESFQRKGKPWKEGTTLDLAESLSDWRGPPWVPVVPPVELREEALQLDPYLLGLLLGDGSFRYGTISFSKPERDLWVEITRLVPEGDEIRIHERETDPSYISIVGNRAPNEGSRTMGVLRQLGLHGKLSKERFIPKEFLWAGKEDRWALLCGLCDTDGHVTQHGCAVEYSSASRVLADDVQALARSLGGTASMREKTVDDISYWIVTIRFQEDRGVPVRSKKNLRKARTSFRATRRSVVSVEPVGMRPCTCISVDDPEQLFVARDFIVTHNSILLQNHGIAGVRGRKKVLHFILEGKRGLIEDRYDAALSVSAYSELKRYGMSKESYDKLWDEYQHAKRLLVTRGMIDRWDNTILDVEEELHDLRKNHGWVPDLIIIDYGDLLSGRNGPYGSGWESDRDAYRDIKTLANRGYVVWTASQIQRPKIAGHLTTEHLLTSKDIAGGIDKVRVADFIGSINSTTEERKNKVMRLFPELIRDSPGSSEALVVAADLATMRIGVIAENVLGYGNKKPETKLKVVGEK